jgi:type II secretory pathway pseudopilin PulG
MNSEKSKSSKIYAIIIIALLLAAIVFFFVMRQNYQKAILSTEQKASYLEMQMDSLSMVTIEYEQFMMAVSHIVDNENVSAQKIFNDIQESENDLIRKALRITEVLNNPEIQIVEVVKELKPSVDKFDSNAEIEKIEIKPIQSVEDEEDKINMKEKEEAYASDKSIFFKSTKGIKVEYAGQIKNGRANGYGVGLFESGGVYRGNWKDNQRHGKGVYTWEDGEVYDGEFAGDKREGFGTYKWKNGERYEGQWKNDMRHGRGTIYKSNGDIKVAGLFENDKLQ